jgi:hypothetical protein
MERSRLSNDELARQLDRNVARERGMTIDVLHDLNEMARRRLHLDLGYRSLFDYCTRKLKYSSSAAARRIQAQAASVAIRSCSECSRRVS